MNTKYLITIVDYRVEEDNFSEGCTGNIISDGWYGTKRFVVSSKEELIKELSSLLYCREEDAASLENLEDNQYSLSWLVNKDELPPYESQIEQWKNGDINLYCADAYILIDKITPLNSLEEMKEK
jgi:hypothetical protein